MADQGARAGDEYECPDTVKQAGVTLVELLVSLALSAITLVSAMQFMATNLRTASDIKALSNLHNKAGHAMSMLGHSITRAGFLGCGGSSAEISTLLAADLGASAELNLFAPYAIYDSEPGAMSWVPDLGDLPIRSGGHHSNAIDGRHGIDISSLIPGNDVLVVRGLSFAAIPLVEPVGAGESIVVHSRRRLTSGAFAAISDCEFLEVFRVTGIGYAGALVQLHRAPGLGMHDNQAARLSTSRAFEPFVGQPAQLFPVQSEFFFIAQGAAGSELPALWRKDTHRRALEVLEGIAEFDAKALVDHHGHAVGLRVAFTMRARTSGEDAGLERRLIRHFPFENL